MSDIERIRALLEEREANEEERGTAFAEVHLKLTLVDDWAKLQAEREMIISSAPKPDARMANPPAPDTADIDARIAAKEDEIRASTVRFEFVAVSGDKYRELLESHPEAQRKQRDKDAFIDDLARAGLFKITLKLGDGADMSAEDRVKLFDEMRPKLPFGELDRLRDTVLDLNVRKVDVPFS